MSENNEIMLALAKVPELVENITKLIENNEKMFSVLAQCVQKRVEAAIAEEDMNRLSRIITETASQSPCAMPRTDTLSTQIAGEVRQELSSVIAEDAKKAVVEAVKSVKVNTTVNYVSTHDMLRIVEKKLADRIKIVSVICSILIVAGIGHAIAYLNGKEHLGHEYAEIYYSDYTTEAEQKTLGKGISYVGFLPREFDTTPKLVKQAIKRNKQILERREAEAKENDGKFSTKIQLER